MSIKTRQIGDCTLHRADCLKGMGDFSDNQFDLAIVDPPYGIGMSKTHPGRGWKKRPSKNWDDSIPSEEYFNELFRVSKNQVVWGGNYFTRYLPPSPGWLFWDKGQRNFSLADGELCWTSFKKALRVFEYSRSKNNRTRSGFHPTEKPVDLYDWILEKLAKPGQTILDTHLGSGSIGIACSIKGYRLVAFETDPEYFELACRRIKDVVGRTAKEKKAAL